MSAISHIFLACQTTCMIRKDEQNQSWTGKMLRF
ncbi:hypothetical protein E1A91_D06G008800v1 [Gossypium mustelinum]|uniref:Uncharacterized protein n=1 Tax=Gossypium mustelinum TaxID=34275 RepID=A0A5D2UF96_GOSMU|nr:hypothetical protein E1A91_D06G008800v1 [Gossypium mustelinum]